MKNAIGVIVSVFLFSFSLVKGVEAYSVEEVFLHKTISDCWVTYDNGEYDITNYLTSHDRYLDIRSWCGTDITTAFETKNGEGVDHKISSYAILEQYKIGEITKVITPSVAEEPVVENIEKDVITSTPKEYNLIMPLLISIVLYWGTYALVKNNKLGKVNVVKFNGFWNSILFLTLLIPAFGFGIIMILDIKKPSLLDIQFDILYWHVELSIVMGVLGISHLIQRLGIYLRQLSLKK